MIGRTLAHYRILEKLGAGGMGEVYLAQDTKLDRKIALKVLPPEMAEDPARLERFEREAKSVAALNHPHIVTIYSVEEAEDLHFFAMEYVEGQTLDALIPPGGWGVDKFLDLAVPLADALRAAHEHGIIHRDLKPANVMVDDEGRVKILDFGLARLRHPESPAEELTQLPTQAMTQEGVMLGTMPYMSPEQVEGRRLDSRSDIFSLGILFYEMLSGRRPFRGESAAALVSSILRDVPNELTLLKEELPSDLDRIVGRCLQKDPDRRYQTAKDVRNELETLVGEWTSGRLTARARRPTARIWARRERAPLVALATVTLIVTVVVLWLARRPPAPQSAPTPRIASLAVLPLQNLSGDATQDYFADGLTEALTTDLARIRGLEKVTARASAMHYKGTTRPLSEIADELGVAALVTGSVLREGQRVQVTAQLLEEPFDQALWSERYQRELEDILSLQNEIVGEIVDRVEVELTPREVTRLADREAVDPEAYDAVMRGNYLLSVYDFEGSVGAYRESLASDPAFVAAYLGLARIHRMMGLFGVVPPAEAHELARAAVDRALELDSENARSYILRGILKFQFGWDVEGAEADFQRAGELESGILDADRDYSWYLVVAGRFDEGIAVVERAIARDPLNPEVAQALHWSYFVAGKQKEALEALDRVDVMLPGFGDVQRAWSLTALGRGQEAVPLIDKYLDEDLDPFSLATFTWMLTEAGEISRARVLLDQMMLRAETEWVDGVFLAIAQACVDEWDAAMGALERALEERSVNMTFLTTRPVPPIVDVFEPLFSNPRYQATLDRIGPESAPSAGVAGSASSPS